MRVTRRSAAAAVSLAGVGMGVVTLFADIWSLSYQVPEHAHKLVLISTMWRTIQTDQPTMPEAYAPPHYGLPVVVCLVLIAVGAVLGMRAGALASAARGVQLAAAGVFGGMVLAYVLEIDRKERVDTVDMPYSGIEVAYTWHQGLYALMVAAVLALVGAAMAYRTAEVPVVESENEPEDEHGVVVHQLGDDDEDTPPFGIAMLHPDDEERR